MATYAIKWEETILVTSENRDSLVWYEFRELTEQEELELQWYIVNIVDWEIVTTSTDKSNKYEIKWKLTRMSEIRKEIRSFGWSTNSLTHNKLDSEITTKVNSLKNEFNTLKTEVDTYDNTLIDDVITAFFS